MTVLLPRKVRYAGYSRNKGRQPYGVLLWCFTFVPLLSLGQSATGRRTVRVDVGSDAEFRTIQQALVGAPKSGLDILIAPGFYREKVAITQANIALIGTGRQPGDTVIAWGDSAKNTGSTFKSATVTITMDGFQAENLSIGNTWWDEHSSPDEASQAVALQLNSDKAVVDRVRLISGQNTLYAASLNCRSDTTGTPYDASRQLFNGCFVEGNVDYIFGDAKAVFNNCELHARQHPTVMITAQSIHFPEEDSGFFMLHCRITGADDGSRGYARAPLACLCHSDVLRYRYASKNLFRWMV